MREILIIVLVLPAALAGCARVQLNEQGEPVRVASAERVSDCRRDRAG